ncbi:hypothetical protein HNQ57_001999 [Zhongshania antarctica]|uniref:Glycosyltransferase 2-like domain-containing protein n=1 Tax=Zhongshania antarctica TaxID=641702 RepID=A0A840R5S3_9GAMM|nr:glycosyltransferase family 2 protein [Zhongshania antarctica]MBB5187721.1 hypothetical protein [Zhongshania antarctica]
MEYIYVVLVNYGGWRDTQECLESLLKLDYENFEIVVVDNKSQNQSLEHLVSWARGEELASVDNASLAEYSQPPVDKPIDYNVIEWMKEGCVNSGTLKKRRVTFIQSGENRGFSAGNNVGISYALSGGDADYIWLLNNDTVVGRNSLNELVSKFLLYKKTNEKVGIIGSKLRYYHAPEVIQAIGGRYSKWLATTKHVGAFEVDVGQYDADESYCGVDYPVGASMFVCADFIREVGPMCEDYFLYFEELDWVLRGRVSGWSVGYCSGSEIFHKEGGTIGVASRASGRSEFSDHLVNLNKLKITEVFYPSCIWSVRCSIILVAFNRLRMGMFRRAIMIFKIAVLSK